MSMTHQLPKDLSTRISAQIPCHTSLHSICVHMSPESWREHKESFPTQKGAYMLFAAGMPYPCLRIGIAQGVGGIQARWFRGRHAHYYTFRNSYPKAEHYHFFYRQMAQHYPKVRIVFICAPTFVDHELRGLERQLITEFTPIWEEREGTQLLWKKWYQNHKG